ncbi:MAG: hypothetical protein RR424_06400 [Oscillospiraceae bacterium]
MWQTTLHSLSSISQVAPIVVGGSLVEYSSLGEAVSGSCRIDNFVYY